MTTSYNTGANWRCQGVSATRNRTGAGGLHLPESIALLTLHICSFILISTKDRESCVHSDDGRVERGDLRPKRRMGLSNGLPGMRQKQAMGNDVLRLRNMRFFAYHGLFPEEAKLGQWFEVDVEVFSDFRGYARKDDAGAFDYARVYEATKTVVTEERFGLVESLADRIAEVLQSHFNLERVRVRVRKPNPPMQAIFDGVEVEVERG